MKKLLPLFLMLVAITAQSQISTSDSTFTSGDIPTERAFVTVDTSMESTCSDTLVVQIPAGDYVYWIDIDYDMTAANNGWMSEQSSYIECVSTGTKESQVYQGVGNTGGTYSYSRNNVNIANGVSATGTLKFAMHAFRDFGTVACNTIYNKVDNNSWTITVHHGTAPTCFQPTSLNVAWVMSNKARVSWTSGGATNWQIEYGAPGFTPGSGTLVNATSNPFTISGLSASTAYDFYVRDSCGTGNVSIWSLPASFSTLCAPFSLPYSENFDGTAWVDGTGVSNANDSIDPCWTRDPGGNAGGGGVPYFVGTGSGGTGTANTGPSGDHTTGSANYVYGEASNGGYPDQAELVSPLVDVSSLTLPEVSFWYHMYGSSIGTLYLDVWNAQNGWSNVWSLTGQQQSADTSAWLQANVPLNNFVGDTIRYRIRMLRSFAIQGDMAVDDVSIQEAPTCPDPSNLSLVSFTSTSVTLDWTAVNATNWDIQYGAQGFTLGSGTIQNVSAHPATVSGLSANTSYDFYVREVCSANDTSNWIGPVTVTTLCNPVTAPYFEDFDTIPWVAGTGVYSTGSALGTCWIRVPDSGTSGSSPYFWSVRSAATTTPGTGPSGDINGTGNYIYTEASAGTPGQVAEIFAPPVDVSGLTSPELRFWYHMWGATMGTLHVDVQSADGTWTNSVWSISGQQHANAGAAYTEAIVDLSTFAGDTIVVKFRGVRGSANTGDIAIDEMSIDEAPTCPDPSNLAVSGVTNSTALVSWTTGGSSDWNIAYGAPGFTPGGTFVATTNNPHTLTGLTASTTYDIYVRDSCGTGDVSNWIGPVTITTLCNSVSAPYTENFDGTSWIEDGTFDPGSIDACWSRSDSTTYWWKPGQGTSPTNNTGPSGDHTTGTGKYIYSESGFAGNTIISTEIQSPLIDLSALTTPELSFYYHMYGQLIVKLEVEIWDGTSWNLEQTITGQQQTSSNAGWLEQIVDISAYADDTIMVKFIATRYPGGNNQADISIDDVDIHEQPTCPQPSNLTTTGATATSITLSWTTGGATNWQIEYGPVGFTPGSGTIVNAFDKPLYRDRAVGFNHLRFLREGQLRYGQCQCLGRTGYG